MDGELGFGANPVDERAGVVVVFVGEIDEGDNSAEDNNKSNNDIESNRGRRGGSGVSRRGGNGDRGGFAGFVGLERLQDKDAGGANTGDDAGEE